MVFFRDMRDCGRAGHHMRDVSSVAVERSKSECKRVCVPTLLVELVSLVSLASVSLIPLDSLVARSWLGDHVDFELGVAAGLGLRLLGLHLLPLLGVLLLLLEHSSILLISAKLSMLLINLTHFLWFPRCATVCCRPPSRTSSCLPVVRFPPVVLFPPPISLFCLCSSCPFLSTFLFLRLCQARRRPSDHPSLCFSCFRSFGSTVSCCCRQAVRRTAPRIPRPRWRTTSLLEALWHQPENRRHKAVV